MMTTELIALQQLLIAIFGVLAVVALAANRIFLGCILAAIGQPVWIWVAYTTGQWGAVIVLCIYMIMYLLGIVTRWPRKPPPVKDDEHDWLGV